MNRFLLYFVFFISFLISNDQNYAHELDPYLREYQKILSKFYYTINCYDTEFGSFGFDQTLLDERFWIDLDVVRKILSPVLHSYIRDQIYTVLNPQKYLINIKELTTEINVQVYYIGGTELDFDAWRVNMCYNPDEVLVDKEYGMSFNNELYNIEVNYKKSVGISQKTKDIVINLIHEILPTPEPCPDCIDFVEFLHFENDKYQTISLNRDDIYDDSWAVIIGIDKYENLSNLDYAVKDAEAVKKMLITKFDYPKENVKLLLNEEANKANIVNVISDVSLKADENDRILVFFAGHGETMLLPEGGEMGYLVPIDGNQENLFASAIPMDDLKRLSNVSKAKHMLFLVDACYGGLAAVGSRGLEPEKTPNYIEKITNIKSRQIITAGGKDEKVFEKSEWGHSAYTKNLLSALEDGLADSNNDGYITADELGDYLSEKVSIDSENQQTPQSRRLTSHEGEFVFVYSENTAVIQDKSADEKLDYLISEMEELKSQQSSDDIVVNKAVDGEKIFFEIGEYEEHGVGFVALAYDWNLIEYIVKLKNNLQVEIGITHLGEKGLKQLFSVSESFSGSINGFNASLIYTYFHKDFIEPWIAGGFAYTRIHGENISDKSSKKFNAIFPYVALGVNLNPYQIKKPIALNIGISMGVTPIYLPTSYESDADGVITLRDWKVTIMPLIGFNFLFPKPK